MRACPSALAASPGRPNRPESPRVAPQGSTERPRAPNVDRTERPSSSAISHNFGSIFGSFSMVFRGCVAQATRRAVRIAEPLFLLTGAVLRKGRASRAPTENRAEIIENPLCQCISSKSRVQRHTSAAFSAPARLERVARALLRRPQDPPNGPRASSGSPRAASGSVPGRA